MTVTVIIGPTASGKSALAVERAKDDNGVIINADAMQCYDALPMLTAQPGNQEKQNVPHRLYGVLDANDRMSAADWVQMAAQEIRNAYEAGQKPYLVGGSGMYVKALMDGLSPMPDIPADIRADVRARDVADLYKILQDGDPMIAARLKPGDTQRIMRAAEVLLATGTPLSQWQAAPLQKPPHDWRYHVVQLRPQSDVREMKIRARLKAMLDAGVMEEVKALSDRIDQNDVPEDAPIIIAHGFRHLRAALKGQKTLEHAMEDTAVETRQYTKRQMTWIRNQIRADEIIG